jgi:WD40 repeat protein
MKNPKICIAMLATVMSGFSLAAEPPTEPMLRMETGMHTAPIKRIDIDAQERYLVTGSADKTVRVWDLSTGQLLRVLRPSIGPGDEGKIYAVAISPNSRTIAAGGWTSASGTDSTVYLFDRATGQLRHRIRELSDVITHLAFRPDGEVFVVTLAGDEGIRVYRTSDGTELMKDADYGGESYSADFDRQGRLVTTCLDGMVRLYSPDFRKIAMQRAPGGTQPIAARFSPDGQSVAVGFHDTTHVSVLSGHDLSFVFAPDTGEIDNGNLMNVTWSTDGRVLYAAGRYGKPGFNPIVRWGKAGRGHREEFQTAASNTILGMKPLRAGGIVYGTGDPFLGRVDAAGDEQWLQGPRQADYRNNQKGFLVSDDGSLIQFGYELNGQKPARFSVPARLLTADPPPGPGLIPPRTVVPGLTVDGWELTFQPTLNGRPLKLKPNERSWSLAISSDDSSFLLGTAWYLRLFDRTGKQLWQRLTPSVAVNVNIPASGDVAVAALHDGTIRWYRLKDGEELLALFPHPDGRRWVLWTPSGYYDASPGSDELLGWHVNRGPDQAADFFPLAQFRETYYRPDIVAKILETRDEATAIKLANAEADRQAPTEALLQQLPPVVKIQSPGDGAEVSSTEVAVRFTIQTREGVTGYKVLVDGRPVKASLTIGDDTEAKGIAELKIQIPPRNCTIAVLAKNRFGFSRPASVQVRWTGATAPADQPDLYVLAIGVGVYTNPKLKKLEFAGKDARDFLAVIKRQEGLRYRKVHVFTPELIEGGATRDNILEQGLKWLEREAVKRQDVVMLFFSGHGVNDKQRYYFLPVDGNASRLDSTAVAAFQLMTTVQSLPGRVLIFLDTCRAGMVWDGGLNRDINGITSRLRDVPNGVFVFASSSGNTDSLELPGERNGAFTKALIEAFSGKAATGHSDDITVAELETYLDRRVQELTQHRQIPATAKPELVPNFSIAAAPR